RQPQRVVRVPGAPVLPVRARPAEDGATGLLPDRDGRGAGGQPGAPAPAGLRADGRRGVQPRRRGLSRNPMQSPLTGGPGARPGPRGVVQAPNRTKAPSRFASVIDIRPVSWSSTIVQP